MKHIVIIAILAITSLAWAGDKTTYHSFSDGTTGISVTLDDTTNHYFSDGTTGRSVTIEYSDIYDTSQKTSEPTPDNKIMDHIGEDHPLHPNYKNPWED